MPRRLNTPITQVRSRTPTFGTPQAVLRIVVRNGFTHDLADLLMDDLRKALPRLERQSMPLHGVETSSFAHGAGSTEAHRPAARNQR